MTNTTQTKFDFDTVETTNFKSVNDVQRGQIVEPIKSPEGNIIEAKEIDFSKPDEDPKPQVVYLLNCKLDNEETKLKLSKTTVATLGVICSKDEEKLIGKKLKIDFAGKGSFQYITLVLSA